MQFDNVDFKLLVNIVNTESFTKGADRSCLSLPAASNRIKQLENQIGFPLLDRSNRKIRLTDIGSTYFRYAIKILAELDELNAEVESFRNSKRGLLRIQGTPSAVSDLIEPALMNFLPTHPDVAVEINEAVCESIVQNIRERVVDLGMTTSNVITEGLETISLGTRNLVVIAGLCHPLAEEKHLSLKDLEPHDYIALQFGSVWNTFMLDWAKKMNVNLNVRIHATSHESIINMVGSGIGVSIVPESFYERFVCVKNIVKIPLAESWAVRHYQLCARNFSSLPKFAKDFVSTIVKINQNDCIERLARGGDSQ